MARMTSAEVSFSEVRKLDDYGINRTAHVKLGVMFEEDDSAELMEKVLNSIFDHAKDAVHRQLGLTKDKPTLALPKAEAKAEEPAPKKAKAKKAVAPPAEVDEPVEEPAKAADPIDVEVEDEPEADEPEAEEAQISDADLSIAITKQKEKLKCSDAELRIRLQEILKSMGERKVSSVPQEKRAKLLAQIKAL